MKKKIIVSAVSVGLALAVIGASVGVYMSYINKYEPIASPTSLAYTKSDSQKNLLKMQELAKSYASIIEQLDSIVRIDITAALLILAEIGPAPQKNFKTSAHLCSWAGLSPRNDQSAGKIKSKKILPGNPYIKSILCQVSWSAVRSRKTPFGMWFWSHQGKLGKKKVIVAVSRKILSLVYYLLSTGRFYNNEVAIHPYLN